MSAADSLILADVVELLGGGVISQHPLCPGAQITLVGFDFGSPQPQTEVVASLLLDGERPTGRRASNRTISLPIQIQGPSRPVMDGARELLQQLIDADTWRLTWTPDPGTGTALPLVFDCFRGTATVNRDLVLEDQLVSQLTLTFPALPYGRSDTLTTLVFPTPSVSWVQPPNPVRLDDYSAVSTSTQAALWSQSTQHVADSFSAHWNWAASDHKSRPLYTHTLAAPVSISGLSNLTFQAGLGTSNYATWHTGNVTFAITLSDNSGHTLSFGGAAYCTASNTPSVPTWNQVTFAIPTSATFDYAHVNSYSIQAWRYTKLGPSAIYFILDSDMYLNGLTAAAAAAAPIAAVRGTLYQFGAPGGTARAPMSAQFQPPPATAPVTVTFSTPGPFTFTTPAGVTNAKVRVKGATGKGGDRTTAGAGGGAGGGAGIGEDAYPLTPGQTVSGTVGAAGGSGGFPTLIATYDVGQDGLSLADYVTPSFTPAAGEVIVVKIMNDFYAHTFNTPTGGGLTFTRQIDDVTGSTTRCALFTAVVGAGGTPMTVTQTIPQVSSQYRRMLVERWGNAKLAGSPATMVSTGSGAPSGTCTTAAANSVVSWCNADNNQVTGTRTYRSSAVEESYHYASAHYSWYWAYQTAAAAGAQTVGLTAPTGQAWHMIGIEIQAFNTGALVDGGASSFDLLTAAGGKSVPVNTATGGLGGAAPITSLRPFLTGQNTGFEGGIGMWVNGGNAALSLTAAQAHGGTNSMQMSSVASGNMTASLSGGNTALMMPVPGSGWATVTAWFRSAVSVRTCQVLVNWYDSTGAYISTGSGATGADSTSAWTQLTSALQAPSNAAFADPLVQVQATGGAAEVHYTDDVQFYFGAAWAGGNGATGSTTGGGAGSSAGDDAVGVAGSGATGGTAPSGGISGGNGGAAGGNNAGSVPGGGAFSTGGSATGAAGANGKVVVTYTAPLTPFKVLLAHAPSYTAPDTLSPLIAAGGGLDPPDGREYAVPSPVAGLNASYAGTYTILAAASVVNTPASSRTVTVTFKQYDYVGGPSTSLSVARTLTPSAESPPIANGMIVVGEISLPVRDIASDNTAAYYTVAVNSTNSSDRFLDVLVLDVRGQLAIINVTSGSGHPNYYLDEPSIDRDMGRVLASDYDRPQATSVLDQVMALSGGPLVVDPNGPGWLLAYSPDAGAPGLTATYYARWRDSRLS